MKPRIQDMEPELQVKYLAFCGKMAEAGIPFALNCVIRTQAEQEAFYAQGRENIDSVNAKRMTANMPSISEKNNIIVTHTMRSCHFPNQNGKSTAFDIMILRGDKRPTWDVKWDGNQDGIPDYLEAARIGKACGLTAGGLDFGEFHDWPHFQLVDKSS